MSTYIQRFVARVKPSPNHPTYHEWQTGTVCLFIGEDDRARAQEMAEDELRSRAWQRIEFTERSTLIEAPVREAGEEVWSAYLAAKAGRIAVVESTDRKPFLKKGNEASIVAPRLTESFIDAVIEGAGGRRLTDAEANYRITKNADYRLGRFILELKDLQSEALEVRSRQHKISELLRGRVRADRSLVIDPPLLSEDEFASYAEIIGGPIRKRLASARDQVRATLDHLDDPTLRGGAILLNSGYGTLPPGLFYELAKAHIEESTTLQVVICISCWVLTDGFDTTIQFAFEPNERELQPIASICNAFWKNVDVLMDEWAHGGFRVSGPGSEALKPLVFENGGSLFSIVPPQPPSTFDAGGSEGDAV